MSAIKVIKRKVWVLSKSLHGGRFECYQSHQAVEGLSAIKVIKWWNVWVLSKSSNGGRFECYQSHQVVEGLSAIKVIKWWKD